MEGKGSSTLVAQLMEQNQWSIRDARETDVEGIMQVHLDCIQKICCHHYTQHQVENWVKRQSLQRYTSFLQQNNDFIVVLTKGGSDVVAFGNMGKEVNEKFTSHVNFEVYGCYVSPNVVRRGVGTLLLGELERRAVEQGGCGIGVMSTLNAIPFYESCGFEGKEWLFHGEFQLKNKCMEKTLK